MKKLFLLFTAISIFALSCEKFDDTKIWDKLDDHENRISELETLCKKMNTNITSLQGIVLALQNNDYISSITSIYEGTSEIGYIINFTKSGKVTIYHGKDGKDGAQGEQGVPGQNGTNGTNGVDGKTPIIGVAKDTDGVYYWTVNGSWLVDETGAKIPTTGKDGAQGAQGNTGATGSQGPQGETGATGPQGPQGEQGIAGITPQLKIEDGRWLVSYDNGATWTDLGQATGDQGSQGEQGEQGPQGEQGKPGVSGDSMFTNIDYSTSKDYVVFVLSNGEEFKIPTWSAFEALQEQCRLMNQNIAGLQSIVTALQNNDYISSITPIYEGVNEIGYIINFTKSGKVTIYHGKDGAQGEQGVPGQNGTNGIDGVDGKTPVIGVAKDTDGVYYWTVNSSWLVDESGAKIPTTGKDGAQGEQGAQGNTGATGSQGPQGETGATGPQGPQGEQGVQGEQGIAGITPQLKIEDGRWLVSYDNGATWTDIGQATGDQGPQGEQGEQGPQGNQGVQGPQGETGAAGSQGKPGADGLDGDAFFQSVTETSDYVSMVLANGTEIKIPKYPQEAARLSLPTTTGFTATFTGIVYHPSLDLKVTVYYSTRDNLTVYKNNGSVSVTEFGSDSFTLKLTNLKEKTKYYYFIEVVSEGRKWFSEISSFETGEADPLVGWEDGEKVEDEL